VGGGHGDLVPCPIQGHERGHVERANPGMHPLMPGQVDTSVHRPGQAQRGLHDIRHARRHKSEHGAVVVAVDVEIE
jgi:hypothetical protein